MEFRDAASKPPIQEPGRSEASFAGSRPSQIHAVQALYGFALTASISLWFIALRSPLWLDETVSYWQINAGFSGISSRQGLSFAAYSYILWLWAKIAGASEIAVRIPSILAMLGAAYLLYRAARELFARDVATLATIIFCVHPLVIFAAIDARPYAFGVLVTNAAILALFRLRRSNSYWLAALFGFLAACILYFHFLFVVILPALAACFFVIKAGDRKNQWHQFGVALAAFALAFAAVIPGMRFMFRTSGAHVYDVAPKLSDLAITFAPGWIVFILLGTALIALLLASATWRPILNRDLDFRRILICASLALIPILILYGVSIRTSIHVFVPRYRLIAVPGIALCWALIINWFDSRAIRLLFCIALVAAIAQQYLGHPDYRRHGYSWKFALDVAERNASVDNAPVLICSDLIESDYVAMPIDSAKDSTYFPSLTYYKLSVPVVPLPRSFNGEARRIGTQFILQATANHQRFLALAYKGSYKTLEWLTFNTSATYVARKVGVYDDVMVLEFTPRKQGEILR